jgi:pimeloyl-ACP methyl ester carboxylesterase
MVGVLLACAVLAGCSEDEPDEASGEHSEDHAAMSLADHCSGRVSEDTDGTLTTLEGDGMTLVAADFAAASPGGTVLVLLHQIGTLGLCGWSRFAPEAAAAGLPSVAIDMCGYGGSECDEGEAAPPEEQVALAAAHARDALDAEKVVLVGASMGGSQTVIAVAHGADVDGWADVSGPDVWEGTTLVDLAADVRARGLPGLVAHAADDNDEWYVGAQALARATGAEFLDGDSGHGWDLLSDNIGNLRPDGQVLIDFALGI